MAATTHATAAHPQDGLPGCSQVARLTDECWEKSVGHGPARLCCACTDALPPALLAGLGQRQRAACPLLTPACAPPYAQVRGEPRCVVQAAPLRPLGVDLCSPHGLRLAGQPGCWRDRRTLSACNSCSCADPWRTARYGRLLPSDLAWPAAPRPAGNYLSSREQACLDNCARRFLETTQFVVKYFQVGAAAGKGVRSSMC